MINQGIMKKNLYFTILSAAALLFAASCDQIAPEVPDGPEKPSGDNVYALSVKAEKGEVSPSTKALSIENVEGKNYLRSNWKTTETVYVHKNWDDDAIGTLHPSENGKSVVLSGSVAGGINVGDKLTFSYPGTAFSGDYTGQDGTLETISQRYDYSFTENTSTITAIDGEGNITLDGALTFANKQAVVKFTLVDADRNPIYPTKLTLDASNAGYTHLIQTTGSSVRDPLEVNIDQTTPHNEIYVALKMWQDATRFDIEAKIGDLVTYTFTLSTASLDFRNGYYYEVNVKMNDCTVTPSLANLKYNFNFTDNGSAWNKVGKVFLFFSGVTTGYYSAEFNGSAWQNGAFTDLGGTDVKKLVSNGKVTAVWGKHLTTQTPVYSDDKWNFGSGVEGFEYLGADRTSYTVSVVQEGEPLTDYLRLNSTIDLVTPAVTGIDIKTDKNSSATYKFACNNLIPVGFSSVAADGTITDLSASAGDWINVLRQNDVSYAYGKVVATPEPLYYYALSRTFASEYSCFHMLDDSTARLTVGGDGYARMCPDQDDWIQAGPNHFVELNGKTWWTTNLASDRHSALPDPWTNAELKWSSAADQYVENRHLSSLSVATFDYSSELPEAFDYTTVPGYIYRVTRVCGTKGFIFANGSDLTKFIFLPLSDQSDFIFYACPDEGAQLQYHLNWHYWAKDYYNTLYYHQVADWELNKPRWSFFFTSTFHIHSYDGGTYPYSYDTRAGAYSGVPDYGYMSYHDNAAMCFPARPVKK
jgi:hypothetical protein